MIFLTWSQKEGVWWKPEGEGYTKKKATAGYFTVEDITQMGLNGVDGDSPKAADMLVIVNR